METRPATAADAAAVASVHVRSWQAAYTEILDVSFLAALSVEQRTRSWQAALSTGDSRVRVALIAGQIAAFVSFGRCRDPGATDDHAEVWAIYALPEVWGTGAGRQLLSEAVQELRTAGYVRCSLWVLVDNARGLRFYRAAGFVDVPGSRKVIELGGRGVEEQELSRSL